MNNGCGNFRQMPPPPPPSFIKITLFFNTIISTHENIVDADYILPRLLCHGRLSKFSLHSLRISILLCSNARLYNCMVMCSSGNDANICDPNKCLLDISHLNDGNGNLTFQVKVFGLGSEISYSYWWF